MSDRLLLNILPKPIAEELMARLSAPSANSFDSTTILASNQQQQQHTPTDENAICNKSYYCIVQSHSCVTVCFADVCGFTALCLDVSAETLVRTLNGLFGAFDMLCLQHGVEKIKTIGNFCHCCG